MVLDCFKTLKETFEKSCSCCENLGKILKSWTSACSSLGEIFKAIIYFLGAGACCILVILGWRKFKSIIPKPKQTSITEKLQDSLLELGLEEEQRHEQTPHLDLQIKEIGRKLNIL